MTPQEFESDFILSGRGVRILGHVRGIVIPQIGDTIYHDRMSCDCLDLVLFAKRAGSHRELYGMCDAHRIQPLGVLVRADSRLRAGRGGMRNKA